MATYRDTAAEKVEARDWSELRDEWMNYVPEHPSPWPVPEHEIYELPEVEAAFVSVNALPEHNQTFDEEIGGLRQAALHESVILIHKAANVLRAAAAEGSQGFRTWSRSSAYHSAFFAMRAVLGLLGVLVVRARDRQSEFQIDLWAPRNRRTRPGTTLSQFGVRILKRRHAEHKELWNLFSRVLRIVRVDEAIWPALKRDPLKSLDPGQFSRVRHDVHYRSAGWLFPDLDNRKTLDNYTGLAREVVKLSIQATPEDPEFPPCLALHVYSLGAALLADLGRNIPVLAEEARRGIKWMEGAPWEVNNAFALSSA